MIDLAALSQAVFARVATDAAGADVRALLGDGASSVLSAEDLRLRADAGTLQAAALPLLTLRRGAAPQSDRTAAQPVYTWYAYGDPSLGYGALDALARPLWLAYRDWYGLGVYGCELSAGAHSRDAALGLLLVSYELDIGSI